MHNNYARTAWHDVKDTEISLAINSLVSFCIEGSLSYPTEVWRQNLVVLPVTACARVPRRASVADHLTPGIHVTRGAETTVFLSQQGDKEKNKRAVN